MPAICPKCQTALQLEQIPFRKDVRMNCTTCNAPLIISLNASLESEPSSQATPSTGLNVKKILTAVQGDASNEMIREVLTSGGYEVVASGDPELLFKQLEAEQPAIIIIDVGLPQILGFQIAGMIKKRGSLKDIGVILLASVHDTAQYKREPDSLYGADDYIERHHIQDQLLGKISKILRGERKPPPAPEPVVAPSPPPPLPIEPQKAKTMEQAMSIEHVFENMLQEERNTSAEKAAAQELNKPIVEASLVGDPASHEAAKRLARIIISDIALYNQKAVEDGVRNGTFYELLADDIEEGKKLYESRVPAEVAQATHYYKDQIEDFIKHKKSEQQKG